MASPSAINTSPPSLQLRVVMLYSRSFEPYEGWYRRVLNQAKALVGAGCEVTLLAWDRTCRLPVMETIDGIHVKRFMIPARVGIGPRNTLNHFKFSRAVLRELRRLDYDVIHCFNADTMLAGLTAARRRSRKCVIDLCEPDYYRGFWDSKYDPLLKFVNLVERACVRRCDHLFIHNDYQVQKFRRAGVSRFTQVGSYPNRTLVADAARTRDDDVVVVGRLGTAYHNNGLEEMAQAFQRVLDRSGGQSSSVEYKLFLAGRVFDEYRKRFDEIVASLGDHVEVRGHYEPDDLVDLYDQIDISLLLYGRRGFANVTPTKLFESMARGVPVVANAIGGMDEIVGRMGCGVIVDETDPDSICRGIEALGSDPSLRRCMGETGIRLARERYNWETAAGRFLDAYRNL
jgi:glycosyltransferase involved in cell wall biosynthesis